MSPPSTVGPTTLPTFARSAAATFTDLAHQATATGTPDGNALAALLSAGATELSALIGDPALADLSVPADPATGPTSSTALGQLLAVALGLQKSLTVTLTVAIDGSATDAQRSRLVVAAMVAARRQAGLRIAAALAASGQLALLQTPGLATLAENGPGSAGTVGTPSAFAPVVVA